MQELTDCVQARLDKTQEDAALQHATLVGNTRLVPAFSDTAPTVPPAQSAPVVSAAAPATSAAPAPIDTLATLNDIYNQRDDRWQIEAKLGQPTLKIGSNLNMTVRSQRGGFIYLFYQGS
jgi:hypothetical protein